MDFIINTTRWLSREFGVSSVYQTGPDTWLIILARASRMFAFGAISLIIALFLSSLEISDFRIGLFMTLTLVGDVIFSLLLVLSADRIGRRRVLAIGGMLMILSGLIFTYFENFFILVIAAVVGVISASGGDFGPFRSVEESIPYLPRRSCISPSLDTPRDEIYPRNLRPNQPDGI
jgi:Arabinose efflux permease